MRNSHAITAGASHAHLFETRGELLSTGGGDDKTDSSAAQTNKAVHFDNINNNSDNIYTHNTNINQAHHERVAVLERERESARELPKLITNKHLARACVCVCVAARAC